MINFKDTRDINETANENYENVFLPETFKKQIQLYTAIYAKKFK